MTSASLMREAEHSNPERWDGEGGGRGVQDMGKHVHPWLIYVDVWQKPQYCKVISLQLKYRNIKKKKRRSER